jgi:predicted PurR-regulated permease PerM
LLFAFLLVVYSFVGTFVFGVFIYYATRPVYDRLHSRIGRRSVSAAVALLALAVPVLLLFAYTLAVGLQEFNQFAANNDVSQFEQYLGPYINASTGVTDPGQILRDPGAFLSRPGIQDALGRLVDPLLGSLGFVGNGLLHLFVMIVLAYYLLKDGRRLSGWFRRQFGDDRGILDDYFRRVDKDFQNIFFGNILNAFLTATIGALSYSALDALISVPPAVAIPYAALVGLLAGVGSLIPIVGMKIVYAPVALYMGGMAYLTGNTEFLWFPLLFAAVSFTVVDIIPDLVLRPYVSGRNLHLGAVMLAYTLGPLLWGWYGIFLGPVVLVLGFHFARVVVPQLVQEKTLTPYAIDPSYGTVDPADGAPTPVASDGAGDGSADRDDGDDAAARPPAGKAEPGEDGHRDGEEG